MTPQRRPKDAGYSCLQLGLLFIAGTVAIAAMTAAYIWVML